MATYRQIHVKMWRDRKVEKLSPSARLLFIYTWANEHRNELCLYELTLRTIASETGIALEDVPKVIEELQQHQLIEYDFENEVVWVPNALKYQTITPKSFVAIVRGFSEVNSPLAEKAALALREVLDTYSNTFGMVIEYLSNGIPKAIQYKAGKGNGKGKGKGKGKSKSNIASGSNEPDGLPPSSNSNGSKYDEEDKALVAEMKQYRESLGIPPTERDWHLRQLALVHKLRTKGGYSPGELRQCFMAARADPYWSQRLDSWATIERYLPKWKRRARADPLEGIPFEPS